MIFEMNLRSLLYTLDCIFFFQKTPVKTVFHGKTRLVKSSYRYITFFFTDIGKKPDYIILLYDYFSSNWKKAMGKTMSHGKIQVRYIIVLLYLATDNFKKALKESISERS